MHQNPKEVLFIMAMGLITFIHLFSLFFRWGELCCMSCSSKTLSSPLYQSPSGKFFYFSNCILSIWFFFFFFITSVSLLRFSAFSFISREFVIDCGSIFQDSCFYSLDDLGEMRSSDI